MEKNKEVRMNLRHTVIVVALFMAGSQALAQAPVTGKADVAGQRAMLESPTPRLAANKRLVFDFWREVFEAHHLEPADKYLTEDYIQHNPTVPTGRKAFIARA